jgi:hypothetical protein
MARFLSLALAFGWFALMAPAAQEKQLPPGEWCQRPPIASKKAHPCHCRQQDCRDPDPTHVSAHVDVQCKSYCHVDACGCLKQDCP